MPAVLTTMSTKMVSKLLLFTKPMKTDIVLDRMLFQHPHQFRHTFLDPSSSSDLHKISTKRRSNNVNVIATED